MKEIKLTQGKIALVDDKDYERVNNFKWYAHKSDKCWYALGHIRNNNGILFKISMHRFLFGIHKGRKIDHKNCNGLDNQQSNLRLATHEQNLSNQGLQRSNTSGFKGVSFHKKVKKWVSSIHFYNKKIHLGLFNSKIEAAKVYDENAIKYYGEFARTNKMLGLLS